MLPADIVPFNCTTLWSGGRAVGRTSGGRAVGPSGGRAVGRSGGRAVGRSGDREVGRSGGRAVGRSGGRMAGQPSRQSEVIQHGEWEEEPDPPYGDRGD